jgi:hypothetical protein
VAVRLTIYSKAGCCLCDGMRTVALRVARTLAGRLEVAVEEVDITSDPALFERYRVDIPVLAVDGREAFRHRVAEDELVRYLLGETQA